MSFSKDIFRANDIRGLLYEVTEEVAIATARAVQKETRAKTVVVGRDMRETSSSLQQATMQALRDVGVRVLDIGMCTTSMYNFAVVNDPNVDAAIMITASHNPPEYNGIKMARSNGLPISGKEICASAMSIESNPEVVGGSIESFDVLSDYLNQCLRGVTNGSMSHIKAVVDYGNGMGSVSVRPLLERLGIQVTELFAQPDARFPNHEANPAKEETLTILKAKILELKADIGIAFDGDADRVAFVDNEGVSVRGDQMLALLAIDKLAQKQGKIIVEPNMTRATLDAIQSAGGECVEVPVGRTFVIKAMHEHRALLGGEVSSHFFFEETQYLESVDYAVVRVLSLWQSKGMPFAEFVRPLRMYANSGEVNTEVHNKLAVMKRVEDTYAPFASTVNRLDGIKCEFDRDWWFILRPSNNEPLLRLIVEATSESLMREKRDEIIAHMKSV